MLNTLLVMASRSRLTPPFRIAAITMCVVAQGCSSFQKPRIYTARAETAMHAFLKDGSVTRAAAVVKAIRKDPSQGERCELLRAELLVMQMLKTLNASADVVTAQADILGKAAQTCDKPSRDEIIPLFLALEGESEVRYEGLPPGIREMGSIELRRSKEKAGPLEIERKRQFQEIMESLDAEGSKSKDSVARIAIEMFRMSEPGPAKDNYLLMATQARKASGWRGGPLEIPIYMNTAANSQWSNFPIAEKNLAEWVDLMRRLGPAFVVRQMDAMERQAGLDIDSGDFIGAATVCENARAFAKSMSNKTLDEYAILYNLVEPNGSARFDSAKPFRQQVVKLIQRQGDAFLQSDQWEAAIRLGKEALRDATGPEVDNASNRLALFLQEAGRANEAEQYYTKSLKSLIREALAAQMPLPTDLNQRLAVNALSAHNFGQCKMQLREFDKAEQILNVLLNIDTKSTKLSSPDKLRLRQVLNDVPLTLALLSYDNPRRASLATPNLAKYSKSINLILNERLELASPRRRYGLLRVLQNRPSLVRAIVDRQPTETNLNLAYQSVLLLKGRLFDLQRSDIGIYRNRSAGERAYREYELEQGKHPALEAWNSTRIRKELARIQSDWRRFTSSDAQVILLDYSFRKEYDPARPFTHRLDKEVYEVYMLRPDNAIERFPVVAKTSIEKAVSDVHEKIAHVPQNARDDGYGELARLSEAMLPARVAEVLLNAPRNSLVILSPDKALHEAPFGALLLENEPLFDKFAMTTVASARELREFGARKQSSVRPIVLSQAASNPSAHLTAIVPTPGFRDVMRRLGAVNLTGPAVTKRNIAEATNSPSLIAVLLHGFSQASTRDLWKGYDLPPVALLEIQAPEVALQGFSGTFDPDGKYALRGHEIARLNLERTQCALLASCQSTRGTLVPGEGPMALSRAFRLAGAQSVTGTLWLADQNATLWLAESLVLDLERTGNETPLALTFAKSIRMLRKNPHFKAPYYWATHVLAGNPYPLALHL